jgi:hypothetical protein
MRLSVSFDLCIFSFVEQAVNVRSLTLQLRVSHDRRLDETTKFLLIIAYL